jgi:hypothetical protein
MNYGVLIICYSVLIYNIIAQIINTSPNKKLLNYSYFEQLKDIIPFILLSIIMSIPVFGIGMLNFPDLLKIFIQIIVGGIVYLAEAYFLKIDTLFFLLDKAKGVFFIRESLELNGDQKPSNE